jgi:hypothetical protein
MIFKTILLAGLVVAMVGLVGLVAMSAVASSHDIVVVPVPERAFIFSMAATADYADAYVGPMHYRFFTRIEQIEEHAFQKGEVVHRTESEIVYKGKAPGLTRYTSYILDTNVSPKTITVVTVVDTHNTLGKVYWKVVRPIHYLIVPVRLDRMMQEAPRI